MSDERHRTNVERGAPLPNLLVHAPQTVGNGLCGVRTCPSVCTASRAGLAQIPNRIRKPNIFNKQQQQRPNKDPSRFQEEEEEEQNETKNALRVCRCLLPRS